MLTKEQCEELESKVLSKHDGVTDAETYALIATIIHHNHRNPGRIRENKETVTAREINGKNCRKSGGFFIFGTVLRTGKAISRQKPERSR